MSTCIERAWWKESVVYQVYPRSFNDSNNDGIGDIPGIIEKLDYIKSLGVDVIWLCPVYKSPNDDNGYDVSDYQDIMDEFGTMSDFDELMAQIHTRGMKLVMDLVANHTSDEHSWFVESRSSKDNPKRDYYIWREGKNGGPPNNWPSFFGGDAWLYDEKTGEYFLHLFTKKQPDVNWENPRLRNEIYNLMKFWLNKGVDGFRMDVISVISKKNYEDSPYENFGETIENVYANGPKIHNYLQEMNREVISKYDIMTVGEGPGITLDTGLEYVDKDRKELHMIFHFDHMFIDHGPGGKFDPIHYDLVKFKKVFTDWDEKLSDKGWTSIFLGNHDFPRIVSRFANDDQYRTESGKLLALMLLTLRGTVYIYQGEEIGMTNVKFQSWEDYRDVETLNVYKEEKANGGNLDQLLQAVHSQGRDNARTPMQWSKEKNAGFSDGEPWIKVNPNYPAINVESEESNPDSILNFYRSMIKIRKENKTLVYGHYNCLQPEHKEVYAYTREDQDGRFLVLLNFCDQNTNFGIEDIDLNNAEVIVSNLQSNQESISGSQIKLRPWEALLYKLN